MIKQFVFGIFATLTGHDDSIECLLLYEVGRVVGCSDDRTIRVWNLEFENLNCQIGSTFIYSI